MRKLAWVALCLLVGLLAGLTLRPDDGTQVSVSPPETAAILSGMNHGKPLPRILSTEEMLRNVGVLAVAVGLLMLTTSPSDQTARRTKPDLPPPQSELLAVPELRGPPARA